MSAQTPQHTLALSSAPCKQLGIPAALRCANLLVQHGLHQQVSFLLPHQHRLRVVGDVVSVTQLHDVGCRLLSAANEFAAALAAAEAAHGLVTIPLKVVVKGQLLACMTQSTARALAGDAAWKT